MRPRMLRMLSSHSPLVTRQLGRQCWTSLPVKRLSFNDSHPLPLRNPMRPLRSSLLLATLMDSRMFSNKALFNNGSCFYILTNANSLAGPSADLRDSGESAAPERPS